VPEVLTFGSITLDNEAGGLNPGAAHPVWAVLAIELNIPLVDRLDQNPCEVIETGDWVKVDAEKGIVEVTKKK
jgi:phosphohistidine swiveling domain-containing protein